MRFVDLRMLEETEITIFQIYQIRKRMKAPNFLWIITLVPFDCLIIQINRPFIITNIHNSKYNGGFTYGVH